MQITTDQPFSIQFRDASLLRIGIQRQALCLSPCEGERIEVRGSAPVIYSSGQKPSPYPLP
jgi:hypothetical protein